jgi:putative inorganic carbon (HCO3(-)) transporter
MDFIITYIYLALVLLRPQDYTVALRNYPVVDLVAIPAIIAVSLRLTHHTGQLPFRTPQPWCVLGLWAAMVFSFVAQAYVLEISLTFQYFARVAIPYLLIVMTTNTRKRLISVLILLFVFFTFFAIHGYLQKFTGAGFGGARMSGAGTAYARLGARGPFGGPNELGTIYASGIVMMAALVRAYLPNIIKCIPFLAMMPFYFFPLWWTRSRQSLISVAAGIGIAFLPKRILNSWWALLIAGATFFGVMQFHGRWGAGSLTDDGSVRRRAAAITAGIEIFKDHPIAGVGRFRSYDAAGLHMPLHNSYAIMLAENGFPGLFFFLSLITITMLQLYYLLRAIPENRDEKRDVNIARLVIAMTGAVVIGAYFQNRPYHLDTYVYLAIGNGFSIYMVRKHPNILPKYFTARWFLWPGSAVMFGVTWGVIIGMHLTSKIFWRL